MTRRITPRGPVVRLEVKRSADLGAIRKLALSKLAN